MTQLPSFLMIGNVSQKSRWGKRETFAPSGRKPSKMRGKFGLHPFWTGHL
jgi:hypothetical protein